MNINFSTVVDYIKNLFPSKSAPVEPSDNPKMDACVLACLATGNVFYTRAMDGRTYLYYFTSFDKDVELAKKAYKEYPTMINGIKEAGQSEYKKNMLSYAKMDGRISSAQHDICKRLL